MRTRSQNTGVHCFRCCPYLFYKSRFVPILYFVLHLLVILKKIFFKVLFSCFLSSLYHIWSLILAGGGPGGDPDLPELEPMRQDQDAGAGDGAAAVEAQVAHTVKMGNVGHLQ